MMTKLKRALVACGLMLASTPVVAAQPSAAEVPPRVLVLPFDNPSRESRLYWLSEGASLLLTQELLARGMAAISRDERLEAFEQLQVPPIATLSRASVIRLGELVGAAEVVTGSVALSGDTFEVRARRIRLDSGRMDQLHIEAGPLADLYPIFERLAPRVIPAAGSSPPQSLHQHVSPAAFENYVKGLVAGSSAAQHTFLQAALKVEPTFDQARLALWSLHTEDGDHSRALAVSLEVAESSPERREAQFRAALSEIQLARYEAAFGRLKTLQSQMPSAAVLNNLGVVQLRRGVTSANGRATYFFDQAMKVAPDDADHAFNLGYAYWIERDPKAAAYWLRQAVRLNTADREAHAVLAAALQASGAATEAARERELARQLSSESDEWEKRSSTGEPVPRGLERISRRPDEPLADAIDVSLLANEQREQREVAQFHLEQGRRFSERGLDREAIAELRRSVYLSPYQTEAHLLLGRLYLRNGRLAEAIDALTISLWSQDTAPARVALAEAYLSGGDLGAAQRELDRALVLAPDLVEVKTLQERLRKLVR